MQFDQLKRREFITLLGGAAVAWPLAARAQQPVGRTGNMPRLGILMPGPAAHSATTLDPFYRGLHELGYIVGQNLAVELRNGDWKPDRFSALATELIALKVDILVAWSTPTARAAKQATNSIPIVAGVMADPVADELVASLARPGGNVTGTTFSARNSSPNVCSCSEMSFPASFAWLHSGIPMPTANRRWRTS
jgi:putative ABC transport system substrate-binding protein